jgi:hypothetical protein
VVDGAALWCFFEGSGAPMSHGDSGGVLQLGRAEGGEGGRLIEEEEGCRVSSPEEGGMVGVAALRPNSYEGRGVPVLEHPLDVGRGVKGWGGYTGGRSLEQKGKEGATATGCPL